MDTIKIFNHGEFDVVRNELANLLKSVKWNTINSNITVSSTDTIDISGCISEILYTQFKDVENIEVRSDISFIKYNRYNCTLTRDDAEYYLVIRLYQSKSVKTIIFPTPETVISSSDDIMFSKSLNFRFENVKRDYKLVVCSVSLTYKPSICRIQYNDKCIDISTRQEGNNLCYCVITMDPHHLIDLETMGVLVDRSGKCSIVNEFYTRFRKNHIYDSFADLCMGYIFELPDVEELFTLRNDDGRDIAWDDDNKLESCKTWIPKTDDDYEFLSKLINIAKFRDTKFDYYVLVGDTDHCSVFTFKVTKYYLNLIH
ncbi:IL-1 receptor antagonist [Orthopoxvirus akhmetapox]|uniref:IL-1 receptor antagonist n=1 Tax=Orthopoxvirus akhmetapox TaxID=2200830 RepID=A0A5J6CR03_9POXV|nr:IL-1 receptor antagonist [Akhmeta virus]